MKNIHALKESTQPETPPLAPALLTNRQLCEMDCGQSSWFFDQLIPNPGLVAISGKPGSYKTFFCEWMCLRIAEGKPLFTKYELPPFFDQENTDKYHGNGKVLFVEEEMSQVHLQNRAKGYPRTPESDERLMWLIGKGFNLKNEAMVQELQEIIAQNGIRVVVLDPFTTVAAMKDENSNAEAREIMDIIRKKFCDSELNTTIIFIHHPSKGVENEATLRGAGELLGKCDMHFVLSTVNDQDARVKVEYQKKRLVEKKVDDFIIEMRIDDNQKKEWVYLGTTTEVTEGKKSGYKARADLAMAIHEAMVPDMGYSVEELARIMGLTEAHGGFRKKVNDLMKHQFIVRNVNGKLQKNNPKNGLT